MTRSRNIHRPRMVWTADQEAALLARYPHEKTENLAADLGMRLDQVYKKAALLGLKKTQAYLDSPEACRLRRGEHVGKASQFPKGHVPFNKGVKGINHPGCVATQFKKGHKHNNEAPLGALRVNAYGYLERKTSMTRNPPARRWVAVHRLVWIETNGPVPQGHVVVFKRGMRSAVPQEITLDKVELVTRAELMLRNNLHNNYPKEVTLLIQARGALNRKINRRLKNERTTD